MTKLTGEFATRREAEMAVERLVQEYGIDRSKIAIAAAGDENTAGEKPAGSDVSDTSQNPEAPGEPALKGGIVVSAEVAGDQADKVRAVFGEFGGEK